MTTTRLRGGPADKVKAQINDSEEWPEDDVDGSDRRRFDTNWPN